SAARVYRLRLDGGRRKVLVVISGPQETLAAYPHHIAGDGLRTRVGVPRDSFSDIHGKSALRHRIHATTRLASGERNAFDHLGFDEPRCHHIRGDALVRQTAAQISDKTDDSRLGRAVIRLSV